MWSVDPDLIAWFLVSFSLFYRQINYASLYRRHTRISINYCHCFLPLEIMRKQRIRILPALLWKTPVISLGECAMHEHIKRWNQWSSQMINVSTTLSISLSNGMSYDLLTLVYAIDQLTSSVLSKNGFQLASYPKEHLAWVSVFLKRKRRERHIFMSFFS